MKMLSAEQIRKLDDYTIKNEPIPSIDLMERASTTFVKWFGELFPDRNKKVVIFCGIGNNGGDGLAIARLLYRDFYAVEVFQLLISENTSIDHKKNLERLIQTQGVNIHQIAANDPFPKNGNGEIYIDAIFGSGLNRPVQGYWGTVIETINNWKGVKVAVDIPSGLYADRHSEGSYFQADYSFSFELPKLAFMFPENSIAVGLWDFRSIGLHSECLAGLDSQNFYMEESLIRSLHKKRKKFDHKGKFGHALLIAGSFGMFGAAILAAKGCLRGGTGLLSVHLPKSATQIMQIAIPEAMLSIDKNDHHFTGIKNLVKYNAIGIGCGLANNPKTQNAVEQLLLSCKLPIVIDADGLNIIAANKEWLSLIPKNSILTPHPKEFERLFGKTNNDFERNQLQRKKAKEFGLYILLKGAHSCIATPEGICYFNATGNPGMATAGSGDVLTGMITGLLAQNYSALEAVLLGVYLHGLAGDIALKNHLSQEAIIAGDIIDHIGPAFNKISK